jgi:hypothetical protein
VRWWIAALSGSLIAAQAIAAAAQQADPLAKVFDELRARWAAADRADAQSAQACPAGPVPRMSFEPLTVPADAAAVDGAVARPANPNATNPPPPDGAIDNAGDRLLQAAPVDLPFTGKPIRPHWMLTLRDGRTGADIAARALPDGCVPGAIAAMPDGGGFLVQTGESSFLLLDGGDLHVKAVYRLAIPPGVHPVGITVLSGNRLLANTSLPSPGHSPPLLYDLSAPVPQ